MDARVRAIFITPAKGGRPVPLEVVEAVAGGLEGDHHTGQSRRRQVLLMSGEILDELGLQPGAIFENVVVDGLDVMTLQPGKELLLGDAIVSVTIPCDPCVQMDRVRQGLQKELHDRRGMFVKVLTPGAVRVGDSVEIRSGR
jgi:MOSC domain-containing protein YiiM